MTVTKPWAYLAEDGHRRISAIAVQRLRDKNGGKSLKDKFWSPHRIGSRRRVKHIKIGNTPFFAYVPDADGGDGGGGESLSHLLFKEAIAMLTKTELRLGNGVSHPIRITHAQVEYPINLGKLYSVDVYCRFESDSYLEKKWNGQVCFEVWNTHEVPSDKMQDLRAAQFPVIEVKVRESFQYRYEDATTDELEDRHKAYLVRYLEA